MSVLREEIENALVLRASIALEASTSMRYWANTVPGLGDDPVHPSLALEWMRTAGFEVDDATAITAAILNRCGVSWDAMSAGHVSKQALHRRLAQRGEELFQRSQDAPDLYRDQVERLAPLVGIDPRDLIEELGRLSQELLAQRQEPGWWRPEEMRVRDRALRRARQVSMRRH